MAEEGTKIEGEQDGSSQNPNLQEDKYEQAARKKGWKPEEEYSGPDEDWVPAKEFIGREKLFDKIHDLKNQLSRQSQKFEADQARIAEHFARVQETEYKRAKKELETQLADAKRAEDVEAVEDIVGQIKEVEADAKIAKQQVKQAQQGPTPEFLDWQKENGWFQKDAEMTTDAIAIGTAYAANNVGKSQAEVLAHVTTKIKKLYSDKFEEPTEKKRVEDNKVEAGQRSRPEGKKKGQLSVGDLDEVELTVMRSLIKRGALKEVAKKNNRTQQEEYLVQLAARKGA